MFVLLLSVCGVFVVHDEFNNTLRHLREYYIYFDRCTQHSTIISLLLPDFVPRSHSNTQILRSRTKHSSTRGCVLKSLNMKVCTFNLFESLHGVVNDAVSAVITTTQHFCFFQFGFRAKHSTNHVLICTTESIKFQIDKGYM